MMVHKGRSQQWDEYSCPVHGLIVAYRVDDPEAPRMPPLVCPKKVRGRVQCGEDLQFVTTTRAEQDVD